MFGIRQLAVSGFLVTDSKCFHRFGPHAFHQRGNCTGVNTAAEKHSERDIAHEAHLNGLLQTLSALANPSLVRFPLRGRRLRHVPILLDLCSTRSGVHGQGMAGHEFPNAFKQSGVAAHVTEGQIFREK